MSEYLILAVFYSTILLFIYWRVRRNAHPSRSVILAFLGTVAFIIVVGVLSVFLVMASLLALGVHPMNVAEDQQSLVKVGSAVVFGAMMGSWFVAKRFIGQPTRAVATKQHPHRAVAK